MRRRLPISGLAIVALLVMACGRQVGVSPAPTPADFPGIVGFLSQRGLVIDHIASGDAGCTDPELGRAAIRFNASGLDQPTPVTLRIYIFRDQDAYDRRRLSVDACARAWITNPDGLVSIDAAPFVVMGQGPVGPGFESALRTGLREAAALP
jgi:hypothetical protein